MFHQKCIPIPDYETSTEKKQYQYLHKKDDEFKENENEGNIEYGKDFINCKNVSA